jgi:hypothetical protein
MSPEPPKAIVKPASAGGNSYNNATPAASNSKPTTPVLSPSSHDRDITKIYTGAISSPPPAKDFAAEKVIRNKPASDITQIYTQVGQPKAADSQVGSQYMYIVSLRYILMQVCQQVELLRYIVNVHIHLPTESPGYLHQGTLLYANQ